MLTRVAHGAPPYSRARSQSVSPCAGGFVERRVAWLDWGHGQPRDPDRRRRPGGVPGGRARPAAPVRRPYRVVRADSGQEALDALREIKLRGEQVALLLADYRMPQMNGIEFLEAAMDLFPLARRVLLTAYADTDAAIHAINVVDLDHYLLKPWHPPEEKLYPVLDALLEAWPAAPDRAGRRDQGRRAPLVGAVVRGPRLPGPQPGALPLAARRTSRRARGC